MRAMIIRNLKVFFRDRASVLFSLLALFIIVGLYILFLGDLMVSSMEGVPYARFVSDSWIMAGLPAVTSITSTIGAFGIMVEDRSKNYYKDFVSSPLSRRSLVASYILSSFIIGCIICFISLILGQIYILAFGGLLLSFIAYLKMIGLVLLSVLAGSSMMFFLVSFFNSQNAFATASTILGTLIGFLTGIYIPIGNLPNPIQLIIKFFPVSHAGALFRQVMMELPLSLAFDGVPQDTLKAYEKTMGVYYNFGKIELSSFINVLVLVATIFIFYGLALIKITYKRRK